MSNIIQNRRELLFIYDAKQANPNGDPMDANRPRIDEETGHCLVTDVRLKRTVRDYAFAYKGYDGTGAQDIYVRDEQGSPVTGSQRSKSYKDKEEFVSKFADVRLFGGVSAPKGDKNKTFNLTGPVQFGMGRSLNRVKENFIKGTGAFATSEGASQRTFREEYNISYGLIGFHGVVNEYAAKTTQMTEDDLALLKEGLWEGTKNLLTRSKKGHMPRLLVEVVYKGSFFIGDLVERLRLVLREGVAEDREIADVSDYVLDVTALNAVLKAHADKIEAVHVQLDERLQLNEPIFSVN